MHNPAMLLGYLTVPLTVRSQTEAPHWSTPMNSNSLIRKAFLTKDLLPLAGLYFPS